ncbi:MAG TPA: DeoR/GlpR family DNA-binding transcription regulator [Spirochaetales bacterium]|nr:DeoR/GlpR transcriptional regulator [Spirochaetales bacterium]HOV39317.1 DeoR/GlpR family DNA-binding transcription regulator [Spirochaetales bacterium]
MGSGPIPADRRRQIHELLQRKGVVAVSELSKLLGVSDLTIRRDLDEMSRQGMLERTHGGAILNQRVSVEPLYQQKDAAHKEEKESIGNAAAALVEDGDTLLINSGSTTLEVIRALKNRKVRIITSNIGAVGIAAEGSFECILIGGVYRSRSNSLIGALAELSLQQVYGSKAFIGVDGISFKYGLTTPILEEAEIARSMIERTPGPVIVVADHSKIGVVSNFVTAPIDKVHILVTDSRIEENFRLELEKVGIRIIIAEPKSEQ